MHDRLCAQRLQELAGRFPVVADALHLLHHLLNVGSLEQLDAHPIRGASWEGFVAEDLLRRERVAHPASQSWFWRTQAGAEIDLILAVGRPATRATRWLGAERKPFGKDASFEQECFACHTPVKANDYVFTRPARIP